MRFPFGLWIFTTLFLKFSKAEDELLAVSLIYRHGDRTPLSFAPNDPHKDPSVWPTTPGELTNEGKRQLYELGKWLRLKYDGFLSPIYEKNEIYVQSSNDDRCLMSAQSKLAGLYKPKGKDVWNQNLPWQPIPVHTLPAKIDDIAEMEKSCPIFVKLLRENSKLPQFQAVRKKYEDLLKILENKSGASLSSTYKLWVFHDTLAVENLYKLKLPDWALDALPKLREICEVSLQIYTCTTKVIRLSAGRFYNKLLTQFQSVLSADLNTPKFKTYTVHDTQIFSVLSVLKVQNVSIPPYAALVIYELRRSVDGDPYVQVLYKKNDVADVVQIADCSPKCEFEAFKKIIQPISITREEFNEECQL